VGEHHEFLIGFRLPSVFFVWAAKWLQTIAIKPKKYAFAPGLPDGCLFLYQNPNLGIFLRAFEWKTLLYFMKYFTAIRYILWQFGIFLPFWYVWTMKKSGSPGSFRIAPKFLGSFCFRFLNVDLHNRRSLARFFDVVAYLFESPSAEMMPAVRIMYLCV
jgi:hypothetical protein